MKHKRKVIFMTLLLFCLNVCMFSQNIDLNVQNVTVRSLIETMKVKYGYSFVYEAGDIDTDKIVSVSATNLPVTEIVKQILRDQPLTYEIKGKNIMVKKSLPGVSQDQTVKTITGVVVDLYNDPIIGANVIEKGTVNGIMTDMDGKFTLSVREKSILQVSYIGFDKQEIIVGDRNFFTIQLREDEKTLEEVVVIGYGVQKKKLITGATIQVKGEDIQKLSTVSPYAALQSQTPGLSIIQNSGKPGDGYKVNIRGLGTTGDASPLIIIDGIIGGDLDMINPSDIESIDVLKDAASAAIYGSRAANGVILVTTKSGKAGRTTVSYDGYVGFQNVSKRLDVLNARQYIDIINESTENSGLPAYDFANIVPRYQDIMNGTWKGTEWSKEFANKNALLQNHAVSISGGSSSSSYSLGITYTSQESTYGSPIPPQYDRYTFRSNSDHVIYNNGKRDVVKVGENIIFTLVENKHSTLYTGNVFGNDIWNVNNAIPITEVYDQNGDFSPSLSNYDANVPANPIGNYYYNRTQNKNQNQQLRGSIYLEVAPLANLKWRTVFNLSTGKTSSRAYVPVFYLNDFNYNNEDRVSQTQNSSMRYQWENTISYDFSLQENHNFNIIIGQSLEKIGLGENIYGRNVGTVFEGFEFAYLSNSKNITAGQTQLTGAPNNRSQLASFFGRINYNFSEKYLATVVLRADGSSNFARGNRWGYFPSVSAGWVISNESFMESTREWMDFLKIRASWGQNGNQSIPNFQYLASYSFDGVNYFFGTDKNSWVSGAYANVLPNKDITWETSEQIDLGLDMRFFNNRLGLVFDWYNKLTKDWLVQAPILSSFGTGAPYINGGEVRNRGVELGLNWNDRINEFSYGVNFNISFNKNKITKIANTEGIIHGSRETYGSSTDEIYRAEVGFPIGYFYGYKTAGVFQSQSEIDNYKGATIEGVQPGDLIYVDVNQDGVIDVNDRTEIGNPNPNAILGLSFNFAYKGFDLSLTANGVFGNQIAIIPTRPDQLRTNFPTEYLKRWHGEGTSNRYPRITGSAHPNWSNFSDIYIENGDYLRIQNITLGYDFKKLFPGIPLQQARLYVTGQNLFTITGYYGADPEVGYSNDEWTRGLDIGFFPVPKSVLIGLNVKF